jgi:hypothetical protein
MQPVTPLKAIRLKCLDCCNGQRDEVLHCQVPGCPLYCWRFGRRPKDQEKAILGRLAKEKPIGRTLSPEQRAKMQARLAAARAKWRDTRDAAVPNS